ncbi:two-component system sensor histidine kinase DegS [Pullulanibacillus pueri]|uniref:Signal transduction histidine-protein kinase/phosphatase DegS n=1 Tax=Pullulanibacillus pueri TaxID=1437324 RepID=A0A8J2ZTP5_9BACL|nr:sensor histidine kinase [Pullulanibacillus pueri]MBM7684265.1 two-component system sensor histidine kinase DegS [Pullulanibacillus pueri]GGH76660.1 signal transduction histidine-protein kinase/phosphatase DegS [Pullulanibacillus pueri]
MSSRSISNSSDHINTKLDGKRLDMILSEMVETVNKSKDQIFEIGEQSRSEYEQLVSELTIIKQETRDTVDYYDKLEKQAKLARVRLAEVSKHFQKYGESEIRAAYEKANAIQVELSIVEQQEKQLRTRRDDIERRIGSLKSTAEKAEKLAGQTSVVLDFLNGDLKKIGELVEDAKQKQAFGLKIIEAQEEERRRLSREIHDGPAQLLAHVLIGSEIVERVNRSKGPEESAKEIAKFRKTIRDALIDVRRIIYDLRPMSLDDLGLVPTLEKYLIRLKEQYPKIEILFKSVGAEERLPGKMEAALFRLVQEAVQNACKHASPQKVNVAIEFRSDKITLVIKDDGTGFDPKVQKDNTFGLLGMRERVDVLEGEMTLRSSNGNGTTLFIQIPILREGKNN